MVTSSQPDSLERAKPMPSGKPVARDLLLQEFDSLTDTPGAVPKLRDMVLQLAVRGSLVPQDPKDEPAKELASRVISVAKQVAKERELEAPCPEFSITDQDKVFPLPNGWKWVKLGDLCIKLGAGSTPLGGRRVYQKAGVKFLRSQNVWDDGLRLDDVAFISPTVHQDMESTCVEPGDVLLNITGASIGRSALVPDDFDEANVSQHVSIIRLADKALRHFIHLCVTAPDFQSRIMQVQVGVSREGLSMARLKEFVVALPPLGEQRRIVSKVDELLALCDELETRQTTAAEHRTRLGHSALDHLTSAEDEQDFRKQCFFILHNSSLLLDSVPALRQAIRSLAVQGRLVPQDSSEGKAAALLGEINEAKRKLVEDGRLRKTDVSSPVEGAEKLWRIPSSWFWTRLVDVYDVRDGTHDTPKYVTEGFPLVTSKNLYTGKLDMTDVKFISAEDHTKICERSKVDREDILFAMIGSIGNPVVVEVEPEFSIKNVALFKYYSRRISEPRFLHLYLTFAAQRMREVAAGGVQSFVSLGFLRRYPFPLPPLAEQRRVVAKVEELLALCDALEVRLRTAQTTATHLLDATLDRALKGEL